jgi:hypothetical protein
MSAIAQAQEKVATSRCDVRTPQRGVPTLTWVHPVILSALVCIPLDRIATGEDRRREATTADKPAFVLGGVG